jgi:hypothetical protein
MLYAFLEKEKECQTMNSFMEDIAGHKHEILTAQTKHIIMVPIRKLTRPQHLRIAGLVWIIAFYFSI